MNRQYHEDSSGFTAGLLLGLLIGAAGGYMLSSDKGHEILKSLKEDGGEKLKELADNPAVADKLRDLEEIMSEARKALSENGGAKGAVHSAAVKVAEATSNAPKKNFFRRMGESLGK